MEYLNLKYISKLMGSWPILFTLMFVSTGLFFLPDEWLIATAVVKARAENLGYIGLTAFASWLFVLAKIFIIIFQGTPNLIKKRKGIKLQRQRKGEQKEKILKNLQRLKPVLKKFLLDKKENNTQKFELNSSENIMKPLHDACILNLIDHHEDFWEVEIIDWVWEKISPEFLNSIQDQKN